jgi:hypothetical protein
VQDQVDIFTPPEARDSRLRRLHLYWQEKCGARPFPDRIDLDPVDFKHILGYVTLVDVIAAEGDVPRRYYFRLDGSYLVAISGIDYTHRYLDELPWPDYVAFVTWTYDQVMETQLPFCYRRRGDFDQHTFDEETIILPLSAGHGRIEKLMVAVIPGDIDAGDQPVVV